MADLHIFRIEDGTATELHGITLPLERHLQELIERNMETMLGVRFLASEYGTGQRHGGRIDSIGIDESGSPVIIEYKRSTNENVINQGLYYRDWLLDHQAEFRYLVEKRLGAQTATEIEWSTPRLICIAGDFTRYDEYAVQQIDRNIALIRYKDYGGALLALELLTSKQSRGALGIQAPGTASAGIATSPREKRTAQSSVEQQLEKAPQSLRELFDELDSRLVALGDDVERVTRKLYFAYRRLKNFACVEVHASHRELLVFVKVDPESIALEDGFTRNMKGVGHYGTGDLEVRLTSSADLDRAAELFQRSYENS
jgi:predicted transport protein